MKSKLKLVFVAIIITLLIALPLTYITSVLNIYNEYVGMVITIMAVLIAMYIASKKQGSQN
ncbi:MAG: hypothetical protein QXP97_01155 [Desulfurococcus sp.]|jgi:ABC-type glycerol-3-phosphate transport system permease component|uniref:hypothetical protein n=1 Tax=Desulfurococcus sp. TaxID=51678 RepID=UPI0031630108